MKKKDFEERLGSIRILVSSAKYSGNDAERDHSYISSVDEFIRETFSFPAYCGRPGETTINVKVLKRDSDGLIEQVRFSKISGGNDDEEKDRVKTVHQALYGFSL